jgi:CrcB protein
MLISLIAVFLGGSAGTAARMALGTLIPNTDSTFPFSTLIINIVGSFTLGFLTARVWPKAPVWVRAALGPGVLGGFTTFSALIVAVVTITASGQAVLALLYLVATLLLGFGAAAAGLRLGHRPHSMTIIEVDE